MKTMKENESVKKNGENTAKTSGTNEKQKKLKRKTCVL